MSDFARQQAEFQRGILAGDDTVLTEILDSPRENEGPLRVAAPGGGHREALYLDARLDDVSEGKHRP